MRLNHHALGRYTLKSCKRLTFDAIYFDSKIVLGIDLLDDVRRKGDMSSSENDTNIVGTGEFDEWIETRRILPAA